MFMHKIFVYKLYLWYPFQFHNGKEKKYPKCGFSSLSYLNHSPFNSNE